MNNLIKNKTGAILPRDIIFMMLTFSAIIAFSSILVNQMGEEYGNENMTTSYNQDTIGTDLLQNRSERWETIAENLDGNAPQMLRGGFQALGEIVGEILKAPITFAKMVTSTFEVIGIEEVEGEIDITDIAQFLIAGVVYGIIIFGIAKVFLRGGDI